MSCHRKRAMKIVVGDSVGAVAWGHSNRHCNWRKPAARNQTIVSLIWRLSVFLCKADRPSNGKPIESNRIESNQREEDRKKKRRRNNARKLRNDQDGRAVARARARARATLRRGCSSTATVRCACAQRAGLRWCWTWRWWRWAWWRWRWRDPAVRRPNSTCTSTGPWTLWRSRSNSTRRSTGTTTVSWTCRRNRRRRPCRRRRRCHPLCPRRSSSTTKTTTKATARTTSSRNRAPIFRPTVRRASSAKSWERGTWKSSRIRYWASWACARRPTWRDATHPEYHRSITCWISTACKATPRKRDSNPVPFTTRKRTTSMPALRRSSLSDNLVSTTSSLSLSLFLFLSLFTYLYLFLSLSFSFYPFHPIFIPFSSQFHVSTPSNTSIHNTPLLFVFFDSYPK